VKIVGQLRDQVHLGEVQLAQKYKNGIKYRATPIGLPEDFRVHLLRFLGAIRTTSLDGGCGR